MKRLVCARLACAAWLVSGLVRADKLTDAEELFRRAKALMSEGKPHEACPLLEESERLDPQMGTLLNLAICHESVGKIASAWGEFRAVEQQARQANREDRVKLAHDRATRLEPRLSRVRVVAPPDVRAPGLVVKVDGEVKGEALWAGFAVDPGTRSVEVSAPGKKTSTMKVRVDDEGVTVTVNLPKLEEAPAVDPRVDDGKLARDAGASSSRQTVGIVVGGLGVATMAAGGVLGFLAITRDEEAHQVCPRPCIEGTSAAKSADDKTDDAFLFANGANVLLPLGLVVAAVGGYMIWSSGTPDRARASVRPARGGAAAVIRW
jgi:hypothetical protein